MTTDLNANVSDLDLEYSDVVKNPSDPEMQQIAETIPEKYKGKSVDDLVSMHVNLEKVLARQGNEVGQLRKIVDSQTQLLTKAIAPHTQSEVKRPEVSAERLLNDPVNTVNDVVGTNPTVQASQHRLNQLELQVAEGKFSQSHPSYKDDVQNSEFQEWVLKSNVRQKLLVSLNNYNFDAGGELWELWDEHKTAKSASETARQQRIGAASTIRSGAGEPTPKPVLSRAKLAELQTRALNGDMAAKAKWEDPTFQAMYQEAYFEKRVR